MDQLKALSDLSMTQIDEPIITVRDGRNQAKSSSNCGQAAALPQKPMPA
jgi:hypothetical protein